MKPYERTLENAKAAARIHVGDVVSVRGSSAVASKGCASDRENNSKARVAVVSSDCPGLIYLAQDLHGCRYWNAIDIKVVSKGGKS